MQLYVSEIKEAIRELRSVYFDLLDRFENLIISETVGKKCTYEQYKLHLSERFAALKEHLLNPVQRKIYRQIYSPIDDRDSWLNAIGQACIDKRLESFSDNDEKVLHEKFVYYLHQLDNLCEFSQTNVKQDDEDIIKLEITSFVENIKERIIRMPKSKTNEAVRMAESLNTRLSSDKELNIITLIKLLQEQLNNE
jgi:hypothetical protein